jgi:hypothetical protein
VQNYGKDGKRTCYTVHTTLNDDFYLCDDRYECMRVPESLPRWLKCVKWWNRDDVLEVKQVLLIVERSYFYSSAHVAFRRIKL